MVATTLNGVLLTGDHASRPAASAVAKGCLYSCTTHSLVYQSDASSWSTWATLGGSPSGSITASGYTQNTAKLLGRTTASSGAIEEISVGSGLTLSAGSLSASGGGAGALAFLEGHTASSSSSLDFTTFLGSYDAYLIEIAGIVPATNGTSLYLEMGTGGGPSWDTTSGHYVWSSWRWVNSANAISGSGSDSKIIVDGGAGVDGLSSTATNGGLTGNLHLYNPGSGSMYPTVMGLSNFFSSGSAYDMAQTQARYVQTTAITGLRFIMASGAIASGSIRIYGIANS